MNFKFNSILQINKVCKFVSFFVYVISPTTSSKYLGIRYIRAKYTTLDNA